MKIPTILGTAVLGAFVTTAPLAAQPPVPEPAALTADDLFDPNTPHEIRLEVNTRDWAELQQRYRENVYKAVHERAVRGRGAGVRARAPGLRAERGRANPLSPGPAHRSDMYSGSVTVWH